jgi:hypothetical protein
VSYHHPFFRMSLSIYILLSYLSIQSIIFQSFIICCSCLSFCFLFSLPLLIQFVCIRVCFYSSSSFSCVCHFHSTFLRPT